MRVEESSHLELSEKAIELSLLSETHLVSRLRTSVHFRSKKMVPGVI